MKNKKLREQVKSYIIVTLACVLYALSFDWFYAPNGFTVGGFTGISQIINFFAPILPVGTMVIVLNVPLFIVGLKKFGFAFLCKSIYTMTLSSILIDVVAAIHEFAPMDPLLACLYGGVTLGIASGLLFREETTTGGSELGAWIVRSHVDLRRGVPQPQQRALRRARALYHDEGARSGRLRSEHGEGRLHHQRQV